MKKTTFALLLLSGIAQAQDIVKLTNGLEMNVKIAHNNPETISFSRNAEDIQYYVAKGEIDEIRFENGTVEKINHPKLTVEQAQQNVVALINENGVSKDGTKKVQASFEGRHLRLVELDSNGKPEGQGVLLDMQKIIRFDETSYRREGYAFINVWTLMLGDEKKNEWVRYKLILRSNSHEKAAVLTDAMRQLNRTLKANR